MKKQTRPNQRAPGLRCFAHSADERKMDAIASERSSLALLIVVYKRLWLYKEKHIKSKPSSIHIIYLSITT